MSEVLRACAVFFLYAAAAMFAENAVFSRALGVSRLVKLVDDSTVDTLVFGGLMCAVQLISAPLAKVANSLIQPFEFRSAIRPLVFILCSAVAFAVVLGLVLLIFKSAAKDIVAVLPMATFNSAVLGVMLLGCGVQGFVLMALNRRFKFGFALYSLFWFLAGVVLVSWPLASAASLLVVLGIWFVIHSIELLTGALVDRIHTPGFRMLVALNGIVTLVFGVMIAAMPVALVGFVNFLFAFFLIFYGFVTLGVALRFRRITRSMEQDNPVPPDLGTE